ncbi:MAG: Rrf2 family transcriptional regulator [Cyanobacteria bacterium J06642_2]
MQLSCKSEYALLALFELAQHYNDGEPQQIKAIAATQDIPERYLEQLLAALRRRGLVRSQRGAKGGYVLGREPWNIDLYEVVQSIEGKENAEARHSTSPASTVELDVLHETWQEVQAAAEAALRKYTLQDLCDRKVQRQRGTVMYYI